MRQDRKNLALVRGGWQVIASRLFLLVSGCVGAVLAQDEPTFSPPQFGIERYEHIWEQSPFVVETQVIAQSEGLEARYSLTGLGSVGDTPVAFLLDKNSLVRFSVAKDDAEPTNGVELVSIELDRDPHQSTATIRVGSEQAAIAYDPAALAVSAQPNAAASAPMPAPVPTSSVPAPTTPQTNFPMPSNLNPPASPPTQPGAAKIIKRRQIQMPPK